jgi:hypothetical protein
MNRPPPIAPLRRMIGGGIFMGMAALLASAGSAQAEMTVAEFFAKAQMVRAMGAGAAESPEYRELQRHVAGVTAAYRADLARQRAAGEPPHSCPPPRGQAGLTSTDLLREMRALLPQERGMSVKQAFYAMMLERYPCEGSAHQPHAEQHQQEE